METTKLEFTRMLSKTVCPGCGVKIETALFTDKTNGKTEVRIWGHMAALDVRRGRCDASERALVFP